MDRILIMIGAALIYACNAGTATMEGIYTRYSAGEFSKANDTLIVFPVNPSGRSWLVRRKTSYTRITNGIEQPKIRRSEEMLTRFDPSTGQLSDPKTGRLFIFRNRELVFGTAVYRKE